MRVALVSPYSWTYPGGVAGHIRGLAETLVAGGHEVSVLAPVDPPGRLSSLLHLGAGPAGAAAPDHLVPLGRTVGVRLNGALSTVAVSPEGLAALVRDLRRGRYDVVHVHEPDAPPVGWLALDWATAPLVGTFHTYNEHRLSHALATAAGVRRVLNRLRVRIAVSDAAEWTARRYFGGRYRVIPNGVGIRPGEVEPGSRPPGGPLRILFVGQPVPRKGLPVLLRAFAALRETVPAELTLIGPDPRHVATAGAGREHLRLLGKVDDARKHEELRRADVLCAPSLGGESFGMVLTEAFAAGTPVVATDIPGYRGVVQDGVDGLLVRPGDAGALARSLGLLWARPELRAGMAGAARRAAERFAWPQVAGEVVAAYEDAMAVPVPAGRARRAVVRAGLAPADLQPRVPPRRLPRLGPASPQAGPSHGGRRRALRRGAVAVTWGAVAALAVLAVRKMGLGAVASDLSHASVPAALACVALMCLSMAARGVAWHASLRAALPEEELRLSHAMRGVFVGVLVSSTLPANLGEPSRALVVARRTSRPRQTLPAIAGTLMSQTLVNAVALVVLGIVTFASAHVFGHYQAAVEIGATTAVALTAAVLAAPRLLRRATDSALVGVLTRIRTGLVVFRRPRSAVVTVVAQLVVAWGLQWVAVYVLLVGLHLGPGAAPAAAAAVLFAVNVTMLLPVTPGDLGVFQAAVAFVINAGWGVAYSRGVAYGVVLQAAEMVAALVMGLPALLGEGGSWRRLATGWRGEADPGGELTAAAPRRPGEAAGPGDRPARRG